MRSFALLLNPLIIVRNLGEVTATFLFLTALFHIPIANVSAIMQVLPLALTFFAAVLFAEPVGWRRMTAVFIGLGGVLIIIRPGLSGFSIYSIYVLGAVGACVLRDLSTRRIAVGTPALFITLLTSICVTLLGAALSLAEPWQPVTWPNLALIAASSLFLLVGYFFTVTAMRTGDIGFVSPFRYSVLLFSIIGGVVIYREYPDLLTYAGSAIIVASGVHTLYRERVVRRQAITPAPVRS